MLYYCSTTLRKVTHPLNDIHAHNKWVLDRRQPRGRLLRSRPRIIINARTRARLIPVPCTSYMIMARSVVLSPLRRSPRLLHPQLAGSKRHSSDMDHLVDQRPPPKAPRVSAQAVRLDFLLNSVSSDIGIVSKLQLTRCTDGTGCKQLLVVSNKRLHRHEPCFKAKDSCQ